MNESNDQVTTEKISEVENPVLETQVEPEPPAPEKPKGIPKIAWIAGCGCLLLSACVAVIAGFVYFGFPLFGGDPIASVVPNSSFMYMSVDLGQTQSDNFNDIVNIAQEMADADQGETLAESMDKLMNDELDMSFTDDVLPWIGRYGALVVTDGDLSSGQIEMMFIVQARNKGQADEFISKFITALEDRQNRNFAQSEKDGVTFYIDKSEFDYEDMVIARSGSLVYLSNSEKAVSDSVNLEKKNSLGGLNTYNDALAALPKSRLTTFYISGDALSQSFTSSFNAVYGFSSPYIKDLVSEGLSGMAMSLAIEDQGLRMDAAVVFDESKLSDYQKEVLATKYLKPTTDALVPGDTFFFVSSNPSQSPSSYTEVDNPLYSSDVTESFDLLKQEYGIDVRALFDLLSGEVAFALGPASDGLLAGTDGVNMGMTILAGTSDEQRFNDWFENVLNTAFAQDQYIEYDISDTRIGDYTLKELTIQNGSESVSALTYGADNGYIVLGTSQSMLEGGFTGNATLADNQIYGQTWEAFPGGSVPYMYLNVEEFMNFLADNAASFGISDIRDAQNKMRKIPVVAVSMNNTTGSVRTVTMIVFIDKSK